jgi:hypothetical protein
LQAALRVPADAAAALLERAGGYAAAQRLAAEPLEHRAWGASDRILPIGPDAALTRACASAYAPPAGRVQLDLFHDSRDQLLEEAVRAALTARRIDAAHAALTRLMGLDPRHPRVRRYLGLMQSLEALPALQLAARLDELESVEPEARDLLGHRARDLLAPLWATLAEGLAARPFDPASPRLHAGYAWARAGRYPQARAALESQPQWQQSPALLIAHAQACRRMVDLAAVRRDWALLCWQHPAQAAQALDAKELPDPRMLQLWRQFGDTDLDLATTDFPAWLLLADPGTAAAVPPDLAPAGACGDTYRLLHRLASGEDTIAVRKALAEAAPELLRLYLDRLGDKPGR